MVCLSSRGPRAASLLRRGSRLAGRLNTDWYAVYVETPSEAPDRIDAQAQRHLLDNLERARERRRPQRLAHRRVRHVILGRSRDPWWKKVLGLSFMMRFLGASEEFDVTLASVDEDERVE